MTALVEQGQNFGADDLSKIEGIGPKIAELLGNSGIDSFATLSMTNPLQIKQILDANGFGAHDPSTWPDQAQLAASGDWDKLREWQDVLNGGRVMEGGSMLGGEMPGGGLGDDGQSSPAETTGSAMVADPSPQDMDDLTKIEGIGPMISQHLQKAGITSFATLATTTPEQIRAILDQVGGYGAHDPTTWPDQAQLAAAGEWDKLSEWQDALDGGRIVVEKDDLTKVEGIGPKIAELLNVPESSLTETYRDVP